MPTTNIPLPTLTTGRYRISYFVRITQAATTSSSLTVTIGFTHGAVAATFVGAAMGEGCCVECVDRSTIASEVGDMNAVARPWRLAIKWAADECLQSGW